MKEGKRLFVSIALVSTLLGATGQFLFKLGVSDLSSISGTAYYLALGIMAYGLSTILYFYILSRVHLSWAYSMGGISYILASIFAMLFLGENIVPLRWVGIAVIAIGVALVGLS